MKQTLSLTLCLALALVAGAHSATADVSDGIVYGPLSGHPDAVASADASKQKVDFYTVSTSVTPPTLPENAGGYTANGTFTITIVDNSECGTLFDVVIIGAPFSDVTGPSQVNPTIYEGLPEGEFAFEGANPGQYTIEITPHDPCNPDQDSQTLEIVVPDGEAPAISVSVSIVPATLPSTDPNYVEDASFTITIGNATGCTGAYTVQNLNGETTVTTYIGFPAQAFLFESAAPGLHTVRVTETSGCPTLQNDPTYITFNIPEAVVGSYALLTPNGGEKWKAGSKKDITWSSTGDAGVVVKLELFRNGEFIDTIKSSTPNDGLYKWALPNNLDAGAGYVVKVSSTAEPSIADYSNASFRVKPAKRSKGN